MLKLSIDDFRCPLPLEIPEQCLCELHLPFKVFKLRAIESVWAPMQQLQSLTLQYVINCDDKSSFYAGDLTAFHSLRELHLLDYAEVVDLGMLGHLRSFSFRTKESFTLTLPAVPLQSLELWTGENLVLDFEPGAAQVMCRSLVKVSLGYKLCTGVGVPFLTGRMNASLQVVQIEGCEEVHNSLGSNDEEAMLTVLSTDARSAGLFLQWFTGKNTEFARGFEIERVASESSRQVSKDLLLYELYGIVPSDPD